MNFDRKKNKKLLIRHHTRFRKWLNVFWVLVIKILKLNFVDMNVSWWIIETVNNKVIDFVTNEVRISRNIVALIWRKNYKNVDDWFWKNNDCRRNESRNENDNDIIFSYRWDEEAVSWSSKNLHDRMSLYFNYLNSLIVVQVLQINFHVK